MKIRVCNKNGKITITKIAANGYEAIMFSDVEEGKMVEIEVGASVWSKSHKKLIGTAEKQPDIPMNLEPEEGANTVSGFKKTIQMLEFASAAGCIDKHEAEYAMKLLLNKAYGALASEEKGDE